MFDLPELDDPIIHRLNRHDLAQCARVSRTWHRIVVPHLWAVFDCSPQSQQTFRRLVQESYLLERQSQDLQAQEQHTQASTLRLPLLAKYGCWIRQLPSPDILRECLKNPGRPTQRQQGHNGVNIEEPTNYDLMRHLYKHCPALQVHRLSQASTELRSDDFLKTIAEYIIPRTRHLHLYDGNLEIWRLMYLLNHGSNMLESFTINVITLYSAYEKGQEESQKDVEPWKLKRLGVLGGRIYGGAEWFWSWLWKRCGRVEELEVMHIRDFFQCLVEGIRTHMPKLSKLILRGCDLADDDVAALLSSSHHGWKEIVLEGAPFGAPTAIKGAAMEALMQQCSVLEKFETDRCKQFSAHDAVQVVASSPNLHTCITARVDANIFIDRYPLAGSFRAWACEASLTSFEVGITGVPRPDLPECLVQESYPGQGREIQSQVYERLARLTKLESLWLGQRDFSGTQLDCLELSLESGLHKLSGLRSLKELSVISLAHKIGVEEVQWMSKNWPELRAIHGMDLPNESPHKEAVEWLQRQLAARCLHTWCPW